MKRLYEIPRSTNAERIRLALAHKGLAVEIVTLDPSDRAPVREISGQDLVPVLVDDDGTVVFDSPVILGYLERRHPDPPLWPRDAALHAQIDIFIEWFNLVWKRPPNRIEAEMAKDAPDPDRIERMGRRMTDALDLFEGLLADRDYLFGDDVTAADLIAFPFLKYAAGLEPEDDELFHQILADWMSLDGHPRLTAWIGRMDERPRAG